MKDQNKQLFTKLHMYALMALGAGTALFFFFKILFG
jgi:hypothetical protein